MVDLVIVLVGAMVAGIILGERLATRRMRKRADALCWMMLIGTIDTWTTNNERGSEPEEE